MTQQEQELLKGLTDRVNATSLPNKDAEAERTLQGAMGSNPDALYILCQTVLVQQFAMDNAQRQLTEARAEIQRLQTAAKPAEHGSFLSNLFGLGKADDADAARAAQSSPNASGYAPVHNPGVPTGYAPPPAGYPPPAPGYGGGYPAAPYGGPAQGYGYGGARAGRGGMFGSGGGFLQGAMQTAAGVVAGEFAFRALEDVFRGFGGGGESRNFGGGDTEVVNNYYGNDDTGSDNGGSSFGDRLRDADGLDNSVSPDIEDRRGESRGFFGGSDTGDDVAASDSGTSDDFSGSDASDFGDGYTDGGGDDSNNY